MNELTSEWVAKAEGDFVTQRDLLIRLDRYAVQFRYPGESAEKLEARMAYRAAVQFRAFVRPQLE